MVRVVFACAKTRGALVWGISPQASVIMVLVHAYMVAHLFVGHCGSRLVTLRCTSQQKRLEQLPAA